MSPIVLTLHGKRNLESSSMGVHFRVKGAPFDSAPTPLNKILVGDQDASSDYNVNFMHSYKILTKQQGWPRGVLTQARGSHSKKESAHWAVDVRQELTQQTLCIAVK